MHFREITAGGESDAIAPDPKDPEVIYGGRVARLDLRLEQTQSLDPTFGHPEVERAEWTLPLAFSFKDPKVLYFGRERLFRTEDGGRHWTLASPDLTREDPGVPANLDPPTAADAPSASPRRGVLYAIAPSRHAAGDLWVGTDDGRIWRTRDDGAHWQDTTPAGLAPWSKVGILEGSHFDAESAYAAVDRHRVDDFKPYVYRTHDGGRSWTLAAGGIPDGSFVNAVREDPECRGLLYAGTEKGVYVSFDDGDHWQSLQLNLPVSSVRDIDVHGNDLVIATHGRAFWVLDDVTPLRQLDTAADGAAVRLFAPAPAVRFRPAGFTGTPLPRDEPMAPNPPPGAAIDYVVKAGLDGPLVLNIWDAHETLVRRYSSEDKLPALDKGAISIAPEWVLPPATLSTAPGMHRFVWPLRYAASGTGPGAAFADGAWAPPGRYRVELAGGGERRSQPLTVEPDPRIALDAEAYARQFALARRIESLAARVAAAVGQAQALAKHLAEARETAAPALAPALSELEARVRALTGAPFSGASWTPDCRSAECLPRLHALQEVVGAFLEAADSADAAPTPDAEAGFARLEPVAARTLEAWQELKAKPLDALNARLVRAGRPPITLEAAKP
jgi:photosystem II stability/assembly factor-like uncharacterized protein